MTKYIPKVGEKYWFIEMDMDTPQETEWEKMTIEKHWLKNNNVFKTKALALLAKKSVEKALREAKKM